MKNKGFWILFSFFIFIFRVNATGLPDTLLTIKPSIVSVGTFMPSRSPSGVFLGTGFAISNGQYIVTNAHVVPKLLDFDRLEKLAIFIAQDNHSKMIFVDTVALDPAHDIAILKLKEGKLPHLSLGDKSMAREGQLYAFTGYPIGMILGLYPVTHRGIISAITPIAIPTYNTKKLDIRLIRRLQHPYDVYQLDATAYPGNSGSPLYEIETGKVIGVINKVFVQDTKENILSKPSGISYAIPIEYVNNLLRNKGLPIK